MNKDTPFYILQEGLYRQYQYGLPDEPRRMARFIIHILDTNGYIISKLDPKSEKSAAAREETRSILDRLWDDKDDGK